MQLVQMGESLLNDTLFRAPNIYFCGRNPSCALLCDLYSLYVFLETTTNGLY